MSRGVLFVRLGVDASARVVEHLSRWMIQLGRERPLHHEEFGLSGHPITRVASNGELAAAAEIAVAAKVR
jgi:hypothetical protein